MGMVKCPTCKLKIDPSQGHACASAAHENALKRRAADAKIITGYLSEGDVKKRVDSVFVLMLEGLVAMLKVWGDMECKGGGCIDPKEALFHCKACTFNGIRNHVDQAIERWRGKCLVEAHGRCNGCGKVVPEGFAECGGSGSHPWISHS